MKKYLAILIAIFCTPVFAAQTCDLTTHAKLSLADFAEGPEDTEYFFYNDPSELTREGKLTIVGRYFEIEFEDFTDVYECTGARHEPCIRKNGDERFVGEARIDMSMNIVVQIERQVTNDLNVFSRGGVADSDLTLWKILSCR